MKAVSIEAGEGSKAKRVHGVNRGISVFDLILRIVALVGTLASAVAMGTLSLMMFRKLLTSCK